MNQTDAFNKLLEANVSSYFEAVYISNNVVMTELWVVFAFVFICMIPTYILTKDESALAVAGIIGSAGLVRYIPVQFHIIPYVILVVSVALLIYRFFFKRRQ